MKTIRIRRGKEASKVINSTKRAMKRITRPVINTLKIILRLRRTRRTTKRVMKSSIKIMNNHRKEKRSINIVSIIIKAFLITGIS